MSEFAISNEGKSVKVNTPPPTAIDDQLGRLSAGKRIAFLAVARRREAGRCKMLLECNQILTTSIASATHLCQAERCALDMEHHSRWRSEERKGPMETQISATK